MKKELTNLRSRVKVYGYFISSFYSAVGEDHHHKIAVLDEIMAECIDDLDDPETSGELAEQHMRLLREGIKDVLGVYAISVAEAAKEELELRAKNRDGLTPAYVEEDL